MTATQRFEDRLLHELRQVVAERPTPAVVSRRAPRRTRLVLAGVGVVGVTATIAVVSATGDVTPSAYAVEPQPGGAVTVSIRSLRDAAGLERSLRAAGVPAVVDYVPNVGTGAGCAGPGPEAGDDGTRAAGVAAGGSGPSTSRSVESGTGPTLSPGAAPDGAGKRPLVKSSVSVDSDGVTFTIDPGAVPPGEKVYITTSTGAVDTIGMAIGKVPPGAPCAGPDAAPK